MNRKRWAPVASVATALTMLIGVSMLSNDGRMAGPPIIRLAATPGASAETGSPADGSSAVARPAVAPGASAPAPEAARGAYRVIGTLPDGPSEARVRVLPAGAASVAQVRALAIALGETAEPSRAGSLWRAGDLAVTDEPGNPWKWGATCASDTPVTSDTGNMKYVGPSVCLDGTGGTNGAGSTSSGSGSAGSSNGSLPLCASAKVSNNCWVPSMGMLPSPKTPSPSKTRPTDIRVMRLPQSLPPEKMPLTESQALVATATIRHALNLDQAPTRVGGRSVVVEPLAGGLPTSGMATVLQLSSNAKPVSATGWLSTGQDGDLYPLRSARKALDGIPVLAIGAPCDAAGCLEGPVITGARLGLNRVALAEKASALVPAWLFTVEDSPTPLVALAVADPFLASPAPAAPEPTIEPTVEPTPAGIVAPAPSDPSKPAVTEHSATFGLDVYGAAEETVIIIRYGESGSCLFPAVRHEVTQAPDHRVVVTLTRTPKPAGAPIPPRTYLPGDDCSIGSGNKYVRFTLHAPLGSRVLIDGNSQSPAKRWSPTL